MSSVRTEGLSGHWDRNDVQSPDDVASLKAEEFQALALLEHGKRAATLQPALRGVCGFCHEPCHPQAVYCDADCRDDHERELAAWARQGRAT